MNVLLMRAKGERERYCLSHQPLESGDKCRAKLEKGFNKWENFEGTIMTGAELGIDSTLSHDDELWLHVPNFRNIRVSRLNIESRDLERI